MRPSILILLQEGTLQDIEANGFDLKKCFITLDIRAHNVKPVSNRDKTPYSVVSIFDAISSKKANIFAEKK